MIFYSVFVFNYGLKHKGFKQYHQEISDMLIGFLTAVVKVGGWELLGRGEKLNAGKTNRIEQKYLTTVKMTVPVEAASASHHHNVPAEVDIKRYQALDKINLVRLPSFFNKSLELILCKG